MLYTQALAAGGGSHSYQWSIKSGNLPPGLTLNATTGVIGGTPSIANPAIFGSTFPFSVVVTDTNGTTVVAALSILEKAPGSAESTTTPATPVAPLATQYAMLDSLTVGTAYTRTVTAVGGVPPYTWSITAGTVSPGMAITAGGIFKGTPTTTGEFKFNLTVTDSTGATAFAAQDIWVGAAASASSSGSGSTTTTPPPAPPAIPLATQYAMLDPLTVGTLYTRTVTATGGTPPYTWSITAGAASPGMAITPGGVFSGTPTTAGDFKFSLTVKDSTGATASAAQDQWVNGPAASSTSGGSSGSSGSNGSGGNVVPPPPATFALTVTGGSGSGSYASGTVVTITANAPAAGSAFAQWTGAAVATATATSTTLVMPAAATTVTAAFAALPAVTVIPSDPSNPILFVTQIPIGFDFTTIGSVFGNHRPAPDSAGRGGDLYIRYPDATLRNLTAAAGFGTGDGFQGANSIAVRDPAMHWDGQKAIFSMVVGAPTSANASNTSVWQLYEITGLGATDTPVITLVPNQPAAYNNIAPCYGTNGRIIFSSDRPRNGQPQLYPQLDEYELAPTVTGLWSLDPASGDLFNLNHTPSGAFSPSIDSFGRVIFTRWDHLQRDQEADIDNENLAAGGAVTYGTFNYSDETAAAQVLAGNRTEVFPEPRTVSGNTNGLLFNQFFPWMINEDGSQEETINHIGRHEIGGYASRSFRDDPNLVEGLDFSARFNQTYLANGILQMKEDPLHPGRYVGTDALEFGTHASGLIVALNGPAGLDPDLMTVDYVTYPLTRFGAPLPAPANTGNNRDPLPLSNGTLVIVHADDTSLDTQKGVGSDYAFRMMTTQQVGAYWQPYQMLTSGIVKNVNFYSNGGLVNYNGPLWELSPVEVRARPIPVTGAATAPLPAPEQQVFAEVGVSVPAFQNYLRTNNLALVVSRNVTTRDHADRQQPFNLHVAGTSTQMIGAPGKIYDIAGLQFFQGDQIRGFGLRGSSTVPLDGRRVLAEPLHDPAAAAANPANPAGPAGSVTLGTDGSMAAFLPARRAMTWQLTDPTGAPVVRERYWLTFQPGEIRSCVSCHGINTHDQAGNAAPVNEPEALRTLLKAWKAQTGN